MFDNEKMEIPKYRKKRKSTISKAKRKSRHEHIYKECLFLCQNNKFSRSIYRGTYCSICGEIGNVHFFESEQVKGRAFYRMLNSNEILEKYKNLEILEVFNPFQKNINQKEKI